MWSKEHTGVGNQLTSLANNKTGRLSLMIYPEATLVSKLTRPKSQKYAEKIGIVGSILLQPFQYFTDSTNSLI